MSSPVSVTLATGQIVYAYPDASEGFSLAQWTSHRVQITESSAPDLGVYTGSLDETKAKLWRYFVGASQPSDWNEAIGYFDLSNAVLIDRTDSQAVVFSNQPVEQDGSLTEIIIGDDYLSANGRAFRWTVAAVEGVDRTTALCYFGGKTTVDGTEYEWLVDGTITLDGADWKLSFNLTKTDTQNLPAGRYRWSVEVQSSTGTEITKVKNAANCLVRLVEKQT